MFVHQQSLLQGIVHDEVGRFGPIESDIVDQDIFEWFIEFLSDFCQSLSDPLSLPDLCHRLDHYLAPRAVASFGSMAIPHLMQVAAESPQLALGAAKALHFIGGPDGMNGLATMCDHAEPRVTELAAQLRDELVRKTTATGDTEP